MRRSHPLMYALVLAAAAYPASAGAQGAGRAQEWRAAFPAFTKHTVDAEFRAGYQGIAADVDGDGREDIVALSTGPLFRWYRNPTWEMHPIETGAERLINTAPHDIDGDGDLDFALASSFNLNDSRGGGLVGWAEAPDDPTRTHEWTLHPIDQIPTSHRLRWADIDGDGRKELINLPIVGVGAEQPEYAGPSTMTAYEVPADPRGEWQSRVLEDGLLELAHGLEVIDWNGDGVDELLTASGAGVHLHYPGAAGEPGRIVHLASGLEAQRPNRGSSEVGRGRLGARGEFLATMDPWHGDQVVIYTPPASGEGLWRREVIDTGVTAGHGLVTGDLNGDGYDEVVAGGRGGERLLHIYRFVPSSGSWERIALDAGGVGVSGLDLADLDADGDLDIIAVGASTANVVWYENGGGR